MTVVIILLMFFSNIGFWTLLGWGMLLSILDKLGSLLATACIDSKGLNIILPLLLLACVVPTWVYTLYRFLINYKVEIINLLNSIN